MAYAYVLRDKQIVGDVWLYNHGPAPKTPDWKDRSLAPFRNPAGYTRSDRTIARVDAANLGIVWSDTQPREAQIVVDGELVAIVREGERPGWSLLAAKDGPLAKVLPT